MANPSRGESRATRYANPMQSFVVVLYVFWSTRDVELNGDSSLQDVDNRGSEISEICRWADASAESGIRGQHSFVEIFFLIVDQVVY